MNNTPNVTYQKLDGITKECRKCFKTKPLEQFNKSIKSKDGHQGHCRDCGREYAKEYHRKNAAQIQIRKEEAKHRTNMLKKYKDRVERALSVFETSHVLLEQLEKTPELTMIITLQKSAITMIKGDEV